jgi:hypothetical protein
MPMTLLTLSPARDLDAGSRLDSQVRPFAAVAALPGRAHSGAARPNSAPRRLCW